MTGTSGTKSSIKKRQIVDTAEKLFTRHGIKRVTIEEICRKAGVSKMTFYKYFANKIVLVKHLHDKWTQEGFDRLDEINKMDIPFPEKMQRMFEWKEALVSKMSTEFLEDFLPIDMEIDKVLQRFLDFIVEAQKKGEIRPEIHPEFLMAVLDKLYDLVRDEDLRKTYPSLIDFQRELKDFFWFGILPRPESKRG